MTKFKPGDTVYYINDKDDYVPVSLAEVDAVYPDCIELSDRYLGCKRVDPDLVFASKDEAMLAMARRNAHDH